MVGTTKKRFLPTLHSVAYNILMLAPSTNPNGILMNNCPCNSGQNYSDCCGLFIDNKQLPRTPEQLMRSRYTAYTQANIEYIAKTMKPPASNGFDPDAALAWARQVTWLGLEVIQSRMENDSIGFVEFCAHYKEDNKRCTLHELSEFHLEMDQWYYINGKTSAS